MDNYEKLKYLFFINVMLRLFSDITDILHMQSGFRQLYVGSLKDEIGDHLLNNLYKPEHRNNTVVPNGYRILDTCSDFVNEIHFLSHPREFVEKWIINAKRRLDREIFVESGPLFITNCRAEFCMTDRKINWGMSTNEMMMSQIRLCGVFRKDWR